MPKRIIIYEPKAHEQFYEWLKEDIKIAVKIINLIDEARKSPFEGKGKPEPLKHELKGYWSRRINIEHRLIYRVTDEEIRIISCKFHYK